MSRGRIIGLTGGYCAGKNAAAAVLEERGCRLIDVDRLGHEALEACRAELLSLFGPAIRGENGAIDRRRLGALVFSSETELRRLESVTHPWMTARVEALICAEPQACWVVNAAILVKMGLHRLCDAVIWVDAPCLVRLRRARRRDKLNFRQIWSRFRAQKGLYSQTFSQVVDIYRVRNSADRAALEDEIDRALIRIEGKEQNGR